MATPGIEIRRADWWRAWRQEDFTWEGLAKRPLEGWRWLEGAEALVPPGDPRAKGAVAATLQHYWWDQRSRLITNPATGERYTVAHLPLKWADGSPTQKAQLRSQAMDAIHQRLHASTGSAVVLEPTPRSIGSEGRAVLSGTVIPNTPFGSAGSQSVISAIFDHAYFVEGVKWNDGITLDEASFKHAAFGGPAGFRKARSRGAVARFEDAWFFADADFAGIDFSNVTKFNRAFFASWARFEKATFRHAAWFEDAVVLGDAIFDHASFDHDVRCARLAIGGTAWFNRAVFQKHADFSDAVFAKDAAFKRAVLLGPAHFEGARFGRSLDIEEALFREPSDFSSGLSTADDYGSSVELFEVGADAERRWIGRVGGSDDRPNAPKGALGRLLASRAIFLHDVSFDRRKIEESMDLSHTLFAGIPYFHGAQLPQRTSLFEASFALLKRPRLRSRDSNSKLVPMATHAGRPIELLDSPAVQEAIGRTGCHAGLQVSPPKLDDVRLENAEAAFRTLKHAMESIRAYRHESLFFKLELRARRLRKNDSQVPAWERWASQCYGVLSDYGDSIIRPGVWLVVSWAFFGAAYWLMQPLAAGGVLSPHTLGDALQHSLGRAVIVGGYGGEERAWDWYSSWANRGSVLSWAGAMRVASMVQSIFSVMLAFLAALALRRKFRIT